MIMDSKFQISQLLLHISRANEKGIQLFWHDLGAEHKNRYRKIITSKKIYSFVIARNNMRDAIIASSHTNYNITSFKSVCKQTKWMQT
jgi:hypothetical protein